MNEWTDARSATLVMDYEYVPGIPSGFTALENWWLDVTGPCGESDEPVPMSQSVFNYTNTTYKATYSGSSRRHANARPQRRLYRYK